MERKESQKKKVLRHLKFNPITPLEALNRYGCFRLADVVYKLKQDGHNITTELVQDGEKRYAKYRLVESQK